MPSTPATAGAPPSLSVIARRVDGRLELLFAEEIARWAALTSRLREPYEALHSLVLEGGKRLRPAFCYWGFRAAGGVDDDARIIDVGAAFELLQAFALVHDDVMDDSLTRRGAITAHRAFADRHQLEGWRGEPRRFGDGVAILIGDLAHVYADQLIGALDPTTAQVWNELRLELNVGQYLDLLGTAEADLDLDRARRIARYKSGKYTIERPLHVGAALAGDLDSWQPVLSDYGGPLGEAFQLRDDLLGAFGQPEVTGKPVGDDIREGKPTPLLALAARAADETQRKVLDLAGQLDLSAAEIEQVQEVMVETGAVTRVEALIDELTTTAVSAVEASSLDPEVSAALIELAHYVARRDG